MNETIGVALVVCVTFGLIAGAIGYTRMGDSTGAFFGFFLIGFLLPIVGLIAAALAKPPAEAPRPPGWYPDPWGHAPMRWWDGYQWTWHLTGPQPQR